MLTCQDVCFAYPGGKVALRGASLEAPEGQVTFVMGASGCGKTTLLECLAGQLKPQSGTVVPCGLAALMQQSPEEQLFAATAYQDVAFGPSNLGISGRQLDARVRQALEQVGLDVAQAKRRRPHQYSGGEQRRLALAGVLACCPQILLLDEPFAGLDAFQRRSVMSALRQQAAQGRTVVASTHDANFAWENADRVVLMHQGAAVAAGPARQVLACDALLESVGVEVPAAVRLVRGLEASGKDCASVVEALGVGRPGSSAVANDASSSRPIGADEGRRSEKPAVESLGIYCPGDGPAYRLHPSAKIVVCLLFMLFGFAASGPVALAVLVVLAAALVLSAGKACRRIPRLLLPFVPLLVFVAAVGVAFSTPQFAFESVVRFVSVAAATAVLMCTTSPTELVCGVEALLGRTALRPGRAQDAVMVLQLVLRFAPALVREASVVRKAQKGRFAKLDEGSLIERIKAHVPLASICISRALARCDALSLGMVNRGYGRPGAKRSRFRSYPFYRRRTCDKHRFGQ